MNSFRAAVESGGGFVPAGPAMPEKRPSGASEEAGLNSVPVPRSTRRTADHRDGDRHRLSSETATLKVKRKSATVELVNLSGGGAMIATDLPLTMWQKVRLTLGGEFTVDCAVRWVRGDRVGLEFAQETHIGGTAEQRDSMLLDVLRRSFPDIKSAPAAPDVETPPAEAVSAKRDVQRRDSARHPLIWSALIHHNHDSVRVRIRNISDSGVLVESPHGFATDAEVLLDLGEAGQHFARVSWVHGDQVGLRFDRLFDIGLLSKTKPEVAEHHWTRPDYLRSGGAGGPGGTPGADWNYAGLGELRDDLEGFLKR